MAADYKKHRQMVANMKLHHRKGDKFYTMLAASLPVWKKNKRRGDVSEIAKLAGVSRELVSRAINNGDGSVRTIRYINAFYRKRLKKNIKKTVGAFSEKVVEYKKIAN